ncbi:preprotein translocase subunit YajC [Streptomyces verrucosisporus]|uniref:preprotein translocase subunit YajC n=1 Tax=Streptomyces verrucosisporus TaxID=1695161 RepID=UPI0019D20F59|nr:preprotein translocase subunit YajC [Streptomyces verrucosisporus]MBN3932720.1 preprotein translocase subunit YajC [Streptomyces verrucosisporus]
MDIGLLLPFIILIGAMLLMTRSAKKKQQQAVQMRDRMEPGTGIRTIGGMYALVKEVHSDTVLLEVAPGVHAVYAKNAVGAVLEADEYERIVNGEDHDADAPVVPDDASSLVSDGGVDKTDLSKTDSSADETETGDAKRKGDNDSR